MKYAVPQFLDMESKIVGPITVRQFVLLGIAAFLIFVFFKFADFEFFVLATAVIGVSTIILAFVRINGQAFHYFLLHLFRSLKRAHKLVWRKEPYVSSKTTTAHKSKKKQGAKKVDYVKVAKEKLKQHSRISDLSLLVDTGGLHEKTK